MTIEETAVLLAKIQLGDNRQVDELTIVYWHETIGDLTLEQALTALKRFRRERPGTYLEPGHLLELADIIDEQAAPVRDLDPEWMLETKRRALAEFGTTPEEYDADPKIQADVAARWAQREIEATDA